MLTYIDIHIQKSYEADLIIRGAGKHLAERIFNSTLKPEQGNACGGKMSAFIASFVRDLNLIKLQSPLVLNLTNLVAMDLTANALLAIGASPIMTQSSDEFDELISLANAVVINMGTINQTFIEHAHCLLEKAQKRKKPVVFDPVGAGASQLRTKTARSIAQHLAIHVIRGNASEIATICEQECGVTKGVDSSLSSNEVVENTKKYINAHNPITICTSGVTDYVFSKKEIISLEHGDPLMTRVTAMGCAATALIGAFLSVNSNSYEATVHAMITMGIAGEIAKKNSNGPGSFRVQFLDALFNLNAQDFQHLKMTIL